MRRRFLREPAREEWTLGGLTVLGIVANPKTNEPALIVTDGDYVSLRSLSADQLLRRLGRGYFDDERTEPYDITGYPRCHTPDGVEEKGRGWGTSLYTGLAVAADLNNDRRVQISGYGRGEGVSSWTENRTTDADHWWATAVRLGLAAHETSEETEKEEDVEISVDPDDLDKFVDDDQRVVYVNKVSVDIEKTIEKTAEYYPRGNAWDHHLIGSEMAVEVSRGDVIELPEGMGAIGSMEILCRAVEADGDLIFTVDPVALQAFDVRTLGQEGMELLAACYFYAELGDTAISELWRRNERGLDPGQSGRGRRVGEGGGMRAVADAREEAGWSALALLP